MIEKIKPDVTLYIDGLPTTIMPDSSELMRKINELVDAVNKLQKDYENVCVWISDIRNRITTLDDPTYHEAEPEPADPYAEQRKLIGKLCKFWDYVDSNEYQYGILNEIDETRMCYPYVANCVHYAYCEPVSEDLIYKGE